MLASHCPQWLASAASLSLSLNASNYIRVNKIMTPSLAFGNVAWMWAETRSDCFQSNESAVTGLRWITCEYSGFTEESLNHHHHHHHEVKDKEKHFKVIHVDTSWVSTVSLFLGRSYWAETEPSAGWVAVVSVGAKKEKYVSVHMCDLSPEAVPRLCFGSKGPCQRKRKKRARWCA